MSTLQRRLAVIPSVATRLPAYVLFGVLKHVLPLRILVRWAWSGREVERDPAAERAATTAVSRLRAWLGRERDCVQSSLVLYRELSRLGANPTLEIGFRRSSGATEGHAWVEVDGRILFGGPADDFISTMRFGSEGLLLNPRPATDHPPLSPHRS
jgi:hypothetical protein